MDNSIHVYVSISEHKKKGNGKAGDLDLDLDLEDSKYYVDLLNGSVQRNISTKKLITEASLS